MRALRTDTMVEKDGELYLTELPFKNGQLVQVILLFETEEEGKAPLAAERLLKSGFIGA